MGFGPSQQQDAVFHQGAKGIQPQVGPNRMAPFGPQHPPGGGPNGGMPGSMAGMNMGMNMQSMGGAPGGMGPGMGGAINVPGGMNPSMNPNGPSMGGMGGPPNSINMGINGPGVAIGPNGQRQGMPRKIGVNQMPMGGVRHGIQNGMGSAMPGQGSMGGMPTLMSGTPNLAGAQGGIGNMGPGTGTGGPNGPGGANGMARMIPPMGGAHGGMSLGAQPGNMGGPNVGPGSGPGMGASGAMSTMGGMASLNGMAGPGAPGMASNPMGSNNMSNGPWSDRQYPDNIVKRTNPGQLDDFNPISASQHPPGHPLGPQPQHPHGVGGSQIGGPGQHGVGGPGQMAHSLGPQMGQQALPTSQPSAGSPVGNLPAHHQTQLPGQMGGGTPGPGGPMPAAPMGQPGGTPRMTTPVHPGGPLLSNPPAPSPHRMGGSPAHHQGHPHQPHIAGSPHQNQMSSPRHMTSSSPAPGQGPHPSRSNAPTPIPPRGASADPMGGMRPDGMQSNEMRLHGDPPTMMRINDGGGIGSVVRGPDGSLRPANEMMVFRDGRLLRDMQPPAEGINRAPSADGMVRQGSMGLPPNAMRPGGEIGRLGPDGLVRGAGGPYGQPPYGPQGGNFPQSYGGIHPTPAQQHQNMQIQRGAGGAPVGPGPGPGGPPRTGSVEDLALSSQMDLPGDLDIVGMSGPGRPGPARSSLPPQMPPMMNGVGGPRPGPGGPMVTGRRPTLMQARPFAIGMGVVRILELSQELSNMKDKMLADWVRFREEFFTQSARISMTIFYNVEGRKYMVAPELIPRYFLAFFESGVNKMSVGLNGVTETTEGCQNEQLESHVSTTHATWRYELDNGWIVEHNGPLKVHLVAEQVPGDPQSFRLKISDMVCNAPTTSYFFRPERIEGNLLPASGHEAGPMTPRISPGLAARQTGEPMGGPGVGLGDEHGAFIEHEERIVYEKASLPPKPFQAYGLPGNVWRLLTLSACVHELVPIMELENSFQSGPLSALDQYAEMDQSARHDVGLDHMNDGMGGHSFPHFNHGFNPSHMPDHSPALTHAQVGMHHGPPQGAIPTTGRPTPTPPPMRHGGGPGGPGLGRGMALAGSGELPPVPGLGVAIPPGMPGMIMSQSPLLNHPGPPGQPPNAQLGLKRKQQAEQGPDPRGGPSNPQPPRGMANSTNQNRFSKSSPVGTRKKAKTNASTLS
ncbi:unnamed protein product [Rhizoctonia solani]|uniref:Uncharacterized protein n=1 Tax=Rhizoctonia solani TaxID=456999 RepID=A0A8H2XJQ5_9AGAM|nr:unnamed protein product [Rhizoctonia solani]